MEKWAIFKLAKKFQCWVSVRIFGGGVMATKLAKKQPETTQEPPKKARPGNTCPEGSQHVPNAETRKVIREVLAGKNLIRYKSAEEMYEDLGI